MVVLSAALLLVAIVATVSSFGGRHNSSLDESEEYLRVPRRLANLAADHDDRDGLARALNEGRQAAQRQEAAAKARQQAQSLQQRRRYGRMHSRKPAHKYTKAEVEEQHAKDMTARDEKAMMSSRTMVPWVQWPKRDGASFSDPARKQLLLQMPMLMGSDVKDHAAKLLPLSAIMNRLQVDRALHNGDVTDTQLAMADEQAHKEQPVESSDPNLKLDCKPFC